jgi:vanillate O-demethylase ferredoxin subunit
MSNDMNAGVNTPVGSDGVFTLVLAKSGQQLQVAADQTALQVLEAAGIDVPMSCGQGICGTCLTRVVGGVPDHRDMYLSGEEQDANDQFTPCCSRSKTAVLMLDL